MLPCPTPNSSIMYLVRHGATTNNLANPPLLQGRCVDLSLSETGRWQAQQTARLLSKHNVAAVYSSPLMRARQTAEAIAESLGLPPKTIEELREIDVGKWEGRSWQEISTAEPERYQRFMSDSATHGYHGGENMTQVIARVQPALEGLMQQHLGQRIVVVAHKVVNRLYLASLVGIELKRARIVNQDNCGVSIVRYRDGAGKLLSVNSVFHLHTG